LASILGGNYFSIRNCGISHQYLTLLGFLKWDLEYLANSFWEIRFHKQATDHSRTIYKIDWYSYYAWNGEIVQYAYKDFRGCLGNKKIIQSTIRKGNRWDNAVMESFFKNLKSETTNGCYNSELITNDNLWMLWMFLQ
jgi:hypothetical protein